jgi:hypothetical protein
MTILTYYALCIYPTSFSMAMVCMLSSIMAILSLSSLLSSVAIVSAAIRSVAIIFCSSHSYPFGCLFKNPPLVLAYFPFMLRWLIDPSESDCLGRGN